MKKLFTLFFLCCTQLAFSQTGVRVSLNNALSVTFPSKPVKSKTDSNTTVYSANQNGAYYIVSVKNLGEEISSDSLSNFYDGVVNSTIKKSNAKLVSKSSVSINDIKGIQFEYTVDNKAGFPDTRFQESVYSDKMLVSFSFWTFKDKLGAHASDKDIFLNSIVNPSEPAPPTPYQTEAQAKANPTDTAKAAADLAAKKETVSRVGYSTGYIIGALLFAALLVGIGVMIKKTFFNKKV
jgi:hypothetical protein